MNNSRFYDGVFVDANRTNEASGRSWHIPADTRRFGFVTFVQAVVCLGFVALAWLVLS